MTGLDLARARPDNIAESVPGGVEAATTAATQRAIAAALFELPVTTVEHSCS